MKILETERLILREFEVGMPPKCTNSTSTRK
jgi:hypothetical protein